MAKADAKIILIILLCDFFLGIFFSNAFGTVPIAMAYLVPFDYILMLTSGLFLKLKYGSDTHTVFNSKILFL